MGDESRSDSRRLPRWRGAHGEKPVRSWAGRHIFSSFRDTPPGLIRYEDGRSPDSRVVAWPTFPGFFRPWSAPSGALAFTLRLQLRGQSRNWRRTAAPHRVPFSSRLLCEARGNHPWTRACVAAFTNASPKTGRRIARRGFSRRGAFVDVAERVTLCLVPEATDRGIGREALNWGW